MKARGAAGGPNRGGGGAPADLLVCFPSRSHPSLLPKAISYYSPSRRTDPPPSRRLPPRLQGGSPLFKTQPSSSSSYKNKSKEKIPSSPELSEPTSPKVTCAGKIKVRHGSTSAQVGNARRRTRRRRPLRRPKRQQWLEALGIKRDVVMHFLEALRGRLRFSFACFHGAVDCTTDDEVEGEERDAEGGHGDVFTRWFTLLEEKHRRRYEEEEEEEEVGRGLRNGAPPANAMILMRCRSAPTRGWGERNRREEEEEERVTTVMGYEVVKETWLVDGGGGSHGGNGVFARSRSCRR